MHHARLIREIALMLAVAVHEPDVKTLVAAAIPQEREMLRVGSPARPDRSLVRPGQLEDPLSIERGAEDLKCARAVPRERDLAAIGREVDAAPDVVHVGHT